MTEKHYNLVQELYAQTSEETKAQYDKKSGIYCILCDEKIIYVGKSTDMLHRFIAHKANTICEEAEEYNRPKYVKMREALLKGHNISCRELEFCDKDVLSAREDYWISKYMPPLNSIVPTIYGGHCKKSIRSII
jgi:predicted GIY-YIG superfamily endonuclease